MVIMPETGPNDLLLVAHKLRAAMCGHPMITADGLNIPVRLSIGTASYPEDGTAPNELFAFADANMYVSKRRGGDTVTQGGETRDIRSVHRWLFQHARFHGDRGGQQGPVHTPPL